LVALFVVLLPACGGGGTKEAASVRQAGGSATTAAPDGVGRGGQSGASGKSDPKGKHTTSTTAGKVGPSNTTTTTKPHVPVTMKLDLTCVRRGQSGDTQGLTVHTDPKDYVGYSTEYSDHSNEFTNLSYKSGSGYVKADENGNGRAEWKVPDNAPTGVATLHTVAEGKVGPTLTFKVVSQLDHC
jgi:hypothetical protein